MPMLSNFHETNKKAGISVVGVAIDNKTNVTRFLEKNEISHEIFIAGAKGTDMMEKTGLNPKNILPFTILVDKRLKVIEKKVGKITKDELLYWVDSVER
jgi:peroxiredoxin